MFLPHLYKHLYTSLWLKQKYDTSMTGGALRHPASMGPLTSFPTLTGELSVLLLHV